ncbi:hypothetical protein LUZ60_013493 [Juncus effusus]|nr:hypothetical protein LUZ60_013493 [Juncus effusus]
MGEPKPQFFQVFSSNSTTDLLIPNKLYTHLPNELPKFATLIGPSGKFWKVEINRKGQNIYFTKGWTEFQSGNYLCSEDLLIFQYDGNLVFTVTIFEKTSRYLKKPPSEKRGPHNECLVIEDSSEAKIGEKEAMSDSDSTEDYERNSSKKPVQDCIDISDSSESEDSLDIGDSSDIEDSYGTVISSESVSESEFDSDTSDETFNEDEEEISSDFIDKRRKLATGKAQIKVAKKSTNSQKTAQKKKSVRFNSHLTNQTLDDNSEGESATEVRINSHKKRRKYPQFEKIIRPSMLKVNKITRVPPEFCKKTGWTTSRRIFLEGKHGMKWPVHLHFKSYGMHFRKGWIDFAKENGLEDGDKCVFILISEDTLLVEKVSSGHVSSLPVPKRLKTKDFASSIYFERTLEECYLPRILVPKKFWMRNRLTKNQTIFLKRKMDGRPSEVKFIVNECGRICAGWCDFIKEHGFKVGDKLSFRFLYENTILVDLVPESTRKIEKNISETIKVVKEYHFYRMHLGKNFCDKNNLTTSREMTLQNSNGKEWHINYCYNSSGGRLCRKGWRIFLAENELKPGDECLFTYISRDTLLVSIIRN